MQASCPQLMPRNRYECMPAYLYYISIRVCVCEGMGVCDLYCSLLAQCVQLNAHLQGRYAYLPTQNNKTNRKQNHTATKRGRSKSSQH